MVRRGANGEVQEAGAPVAELSPLSAVRYSRVATQPRPVSAAVVPHGKRIGRLFRGLESATMAGEASCSAAASMVIRGEPLPWVAWRHPLSPRCSGLCTSFD